MKKTELERMHMDPEGITMLSECANGIKAKYGTTGLQIMADSKIRYAEPLASDVRPTADEIRLNEQELIRNR